MAEVTINGQKYTVLSDSALPEGRRGLSRRTRDAQATDPGRIRTASWKMSGPIGQSREAPDGFLGHDYSDQIDTRNNDLLTSTAARTAITLSSQDSATATNSAKFGGFKFGAAATKFGGALTATAVSHIDEDRQHLFFHRGRISTQVDPSDWGVVNAVTHDAPVLGAAVWKGKGYTGHGSTLLLQRRISVTPTGATYQTALADTFAKELTVGNDRLWMVKSTTDDSEDNRVFYSLDDLATVSNSFVVGDDKIGATSIGTLGPFTAMGTQTGAFSFTDTGKPVRLQETLRGHRSANNGIRMGSLWGWLYICGDLGMEAWDGGTVMNPVGPESLLDFEGPIDGRPLTVFPYKNSLFAVYLTTAGHSYILRGEFDDGRYGGNTAATGRPAWFPFRRQASTSVDAVFSTSIPTNPTLVTGEDTEGARYAMGRRGRDIADGNYVFSTDGGTWYGSAMTRDTQMLKNVRWGKFITENCDASNTWRMAVSVDGGTYVNVGAAVAGNGAQTVRPVSGSAPLATVNGQTIKPRLTQVAASSSAPPQIRGTLEIAYDERPEQIEEIAVVIDLGQQGAVKEAQYDALVVLAGNSTGTPDTMRINTQDITDSYGFVVSVSDMNDIKGDGRMSCTVTLHQWGVS
jgi:hypothetical protein